MSSLSTRNGVDPATDAALLLSRLGLATLAILTPVVAMASRRVIFTLAPVSAALILIAAALGARRHSLRALRQGLASPIGLTAIFLAFWSLLSLAWTPFPLEAAARFARIAGAIGLAAAAAGLLPATARASNLYLLPLGAGLTALVGLLVDFKMLTPLTGLFEVDAITQERAMAGAVTMLWPALAALAVRERWILAAIAALLTCAAVVFAQSPPALAGLAAGGAVFAASAGAPRLMGRILGVAAAAMVLAAPLLPLAAQAIPRTGWFAPEGPLSETMLALDIWRAIVLGDGWRLLTGHGLDTVARGLARGVLSQDAPNGLAFEIWFELGAIGALAYAWLAALCFTAAGQSSAKIAPFVLAALAAALVMAFLELPSGQLWWVNNLGLAGIAFTHVLRAQSLTRRVQPRRGDGRRRAA